MTTVGDRIQKGQTHAIDRQAFFVVQAILDVALQLEQRRDALRQDGSDAPRLRALALTDIDRLSNLVALATTLPLDDLQSDTRATLDSTLLDLRRRISRLGTALTIAKIRDLRTTAEQSAQRHEHPLGKSYVLRGRFLRYLGYLTGLTEGLTPEHEQDVRTTAASINALIAADGKRSNLRSFIGEPDLPPIDMDTVDFTELRDDPAEIEHAA